MIVSVITKIFAKNQNQGGVTILVISRGRHQRCRPKNSREKALYGPAQNFRVGM